MQAELDNLAYYEEELEEQLETAIKKRWAVEKLLEEVEHETDDAIAKLELLEGQVLKVENLQLKEALGKSHLTSEAYDDGASGKNDYDVSYLVQSWEAKLQGSDKGRRGNIKNKTDNLESAGFLSSAEECVPFTLGTSSRNLESREDLNERRAIALSQSLFSALLSLLIRIIFWKTEDTCMPLLLALFTVVGMSLKSVVQFFSTINNKPATDAVALLSLNCFILGTLTYPTFLKLL